MGSAQEPEKTERSSPKRGVLRTWRLPTAFQADIPRFSTASALGSHTAGTPARWRANDAPFPDERAILEADRHFYVRQNAQQHHIAMNPSDLLLNRREIV